ncbi:MAG TPA: M28 family peptidase [Acidobacteriota bacterium]|nr:M28 family peptidase [Acidobacteriota bacterium]
MLRSVLLQCFVMSLMFGCSKQDVVPPEFNGQRAFSYLVGQVEFGPRVPGTEASEACRSYLVRHFQSLSFEVDSQSFSFYDPYSRSDVPLVNVIARFHGTDDAARSIVLMAHYDSRPRTDYAFDSTLRDQPIDGANDGASGVAVLMELGNLMAERPPRCNLDLVLVDGEDWGRLGDDEYYLLGSRHFAASGIRDRYRFGIVVDMVGDANQEIFREEFSQKFVTELNDFVWSTARQLNLSTFQDTTRHAMMDDHLSLNVGGVPAVLIVDFDYPYWHTEYDRPDRCSAESLENVGRLLAQIVYTSSWPKLK